MKKIVCIIFFYYTTFAQQAKVIYHADFLPVPGIKTTEADREKMKRVSGFVDDYGEYLKLHRYVLIFNPDESYYHVESMEMPEDVENPTAYKLSESGAIAKGDFYQNRKRRLVLNLSEQKHEKILISDTLSQDHWQITGETKTIGKYHCIKAIWKCSRCKNPTEAWFTPEIPVPFGPAGYGGLPGLILELKKYRTILTAEKIQWLKEKPHIKIPEADKQMTRAQYKAMLHRKRMEIRRRARQRRESF